MPIKSCMNMVKAMKEYWTRINNPRDSDRYKNIPTDTDYGHVGKR